MNKDSKNQFANEKNGDSSYSISETILKKASKRLLCSIKYIYIYIFKECTNKIE